MNVDRKAFDAAIIRAVADATETHGSDLAAEGARLTSMAVALIDKHKTSAEAGYIAMEMLAQIFTLARDACREGGE